MRVLISGASLAGPTLAYFLARQGHRVTVVERAAKPRVGGSPIDIRGAGLAVAERMGILSRVREVRTNTAGIDFVDATGRRVVTLDPNLFAEDPGRDVELERADLVRIIHEVAREGVEYLFDDSIETLSQDADGARVSFRRGAAREFDLVIGADGLHSAVRRLAFGPESGFVRHLGLYVALVTVDPALGRPDRGVMHNAPGKLAGVYSHRGTASAIFLFRSPPLTYDYRDVDQQKKLLLDAFGDVSWRVPELLDAVRATDELYFDSVSQVRMSAWSSGRVALVGDAGYCPALLSGAGTTLAMVGAAALADALAEAGDDHAEAFRRYERAHRPLVDRAQSGVMANAGVLVPATRAAIWRRNQLVRVLPLVAAARRVLTRARGAS